VPFLAAEIPSHENGDLAADGLSVTWRLRQGVQWSDSTPFTADDVRFTYEYITNPAIDSPAAAAYEQVEQVEVLDEHTVRVSFRTPDPAWAVPFVGRYGLILPRHMFEAYSNDTYREAPANTMPVGTGPYRVVSFAPQEVLFLGDRLVETNRVLYEPNPTFRPAQAADMPSFGLVELQGWGLPDMSASAVLENGTADYVYDLHVQDEELQRMEAKGQGTVNINFGSKLLLIELNTVDPARVSGALPHPIFEDAQVRQAVSAAIDREAIINTIYGRTARPTSNVLVAPEEYRSPNTSSTFAPARAEALLAESGWNDTNGDGVRERDGEPLRIVYQASDEPLSLAIMQLVRQNLGACTC
jgi:peptide/nickel transport system substrate-binding protein